MSPPLLELPERPAVRKGTFDSAQLLPLLPRLFEKYWATEEAFSEETLNKHRCTPPHVSDPSSPDHRSTDASSTRHDSVVTNTPPVIYIEPHALSDRSNCITDLDLDEVLHQLRPAYQLATYFLTNEHALQWFTHVSLSDIQVSTGYDCLQEDMNSPPPPPKPVREEQTALVKAMTKRGWNAVLETFGL
jgi:hypothetical protein